MATERFYCRLLNGRFVGPLDLAVLKTLALGEQIAPETTLASEDGRRFRADEKLAADDFSLRATREEPPRVAPEISLEPEDAGRRLENPYNAPSADDWGIPAPRNVDFPSPPIVNDGEIVERVVCKAKSGVVLRVLCWGAVVAAIVFFVATCFRFLFWLFVVSALGVLAIKATRSIIDAAKKIAAFFEGRS